MSWTTSPVTHTAETAVNRASTRRAPSPSAVANGTIRSAANSTTTHAKTVTASRAGARKASSSTSSRSPNSRFRRLPAIRSAPSTMSVDRRPTLPRRGSPSGQKPLRRRAARPLPWAGAPRPAGLESATARVRLRTRASHVACPPRPHDAAHRGARPARPAHARAGGRRAGVRRRDRDGARRRLRRRRPARRDDAGAGRGARAGHRRRPAVRRDARGRRTAARRVRRRSPTRSGRARSRTA